jgi:two-component system response regulator AlgR
VLRDLSDKAGVVEPRKNVCARVHGELKLIPINSVGYFIADQKYVSVVHSGGSDLIDDPLKALEEEFERQFVRIHRGALVALSAIESSKKTEDGRTQVMLRNITTDDELIVSRRHITNVKRRLKKG